MRWRKIPGVPYYSASTSGLIRSDGGPVLRKGEWCKLAIKVLSPYALIRGYQLVSIRGKTYRVHRLVWAAFNGPIPAGFSVNHLDFNPSNNSLDNLEICTHIENMHHSLRAGRLKKRPLSDLDIVVIRKSKRSLAMLSRLFKVGQPTISKIRLRKIHRHVIDCGQNF